MSTPSSRGYLGQPEFSEREPQRGVFKRILKWVLGLLVLVAIGIGFWGYAADTDPSAMRAKYSNSASQFIEVEPGLILHVRDEGRRDGPVLVLLHGSNASLHTWEPWVKRLGSKYRIISYDQAGHGLTGPHPRKAYEALDYGRTLSLLMEKLKINNFALAGNSMGGWVAYNYARANPEKLTALILLDAGNVPGGEAQSLPLGYRLAYMPVIKEFMPYITPRSVIEKSIRQTLSVQAPINDVMIDRYWELIRYPGNRVAAGHRFAVKRKLPTPGEMQSITMPTLILWGAKDTLTLPPAADWLENNIAGSKKIIYPNVGHIPMEEAPDQSANDVAAFLDAALQNAKAN